MAKLMIENQETIIVDEETVDEPRLSKRSRIDESRMNTMHFKTLKLHTRLMVYDYIDSDLNHGIYFPELLRVSCLRMTVLASIMGDLDALQYLAGITDNIYTHFKNYSVTQTNGVFSLECICIILATNAHWKALTWAISQNYPHSQCTLTGAVKGGADLEMLRWLHSKGCLGGTVTFMTAAIRGDWDIMKWLYEIRCPWDSITFGTAIHYCDMNILFWLLRNNCPWNEHVFRCAIAKDDFHRIVWLRMEGCPWNSGVFNYAIVNGTNFVTLKWMLYEDRSLIDDYSFRLALKRGDMDILNWLHENNCPMTTSDFVYAIQSNITLSILRTMRIMRCPWSDRTFLAAIDRGDWDILKWLRKKNCPWSPRCYKNALTKKKYDIVKWLHEENCPHDDETFKLVMQSFLRTFEEPNGA